MHLIRHLGDFFYKGNGEGEKLNTYDPHRLPLEFLETDDTGEEYSKKGGFAYR